MFNKIECYFILYICVCVFVQQVTKTCGQVTNYKLVRSSNAYLYCKQFT